MALNIENIIAEIKEASILELNDLVKAIEEEFGVTAAAPVAVAAAGAADAGAAKDSFDIELTSAGDKKVGVIKVVREITGLGLKEAKELVDGAPGVIKEGVAAAEAEEIKGGAIEGAVASKEEILALATLPNREGLLSMLLSVLQAPVRNVALAVKAVADNKEDAA